MTEKTKNILKGAGIAGLGGVVGAGLDLYFNDGKHIGQYIKPVLAWGTGGALSGALQAATDEKSTKGTNMNVSESAVLKIDNLVETLEEIIQRELNKQLKNNMLVGGLTGVGAGLAGSGLLTASGIPVVPPALMATGAGIGSGTAYLGTKAYQKVKHGKTGKTGK